MKFLYNHLNFFVLSMKSKKVNLGRLHSFIFTNHSTSMTISRGGSNVISTGTIKSSNINIFPNYSDNS